MCFCRKYGKNLVKREKRDKYQKHVNRYIKPQSNISPSILAISQQCTQIVHIIDQWRDLLRKLN